MLSSSKSSSTKISIISSGKLPIYRRTSTLKCDFNKVALQLYWNYTSAWMFSCKFAAYFQNSFSQKHLWVTASDRLERDHQPKQFHCFQSKLFPLCLGTWPYRVNNSSNSLRHSLSARCAYITWTGKVATMIDTWLVFPNRNFLLKIFSRALLISVSLYLYKWYTTDINNWYQCNY